MDKLTTVGLDLAKDLIAVCVMDQHGAVFKQNVGPRNCNHASWRWRPAVRHTIGGAGLPHAAIRPT